MVEPSLRYVIIHVRGETCSSRTEYILGRKSRSEWRDCRTLYDGDPNQPSTLRVEYGPLCALVLNRDINYQFHLDLESRVYKAFHSSAYGGPNGFRPQARTHQPSGRTVHVQTETVDTGERREMYGYTARRVTIRTIYSYSPENDRGSSDTEADGWYIDPPAALRALHPPMSGHAIVQAVVNGRVDTPIFTDTGPRETGFALLVKQTAHFSSRDAKGNIRIHTSEYRDEVTEFSEEALSADLFVPPPTFRRVAHLPGEPAAPFALRMRLTWQNLKHKFIAKY